MAQDAQQKLLKPTGTHAKPQNKNQTKKEIIKFTIQYLHKFSNQNLILNILIKNKTLNTYS